MTMPFRVIPFEKKVFEEVVFLLKYHQNPQNPQETENNKRRERKIIEKVRKKRRKKKLKQSLQIKGKSIF
jgi:hypothetical protein